MTKLVVMCPWPADPDRFREHYISSDICHCAGRFPARSAVRYTFEPRTMQGTTRHFCIYEAEYADEAALEAALASAECQRAAADVANYSPEPPVALIYGLTPI